MSKPEPFVVHPVALPLLWASFAKKLKFREVCRHLHISTRRALRPHLLEPPKAYRLAEACGVSDPMMFLALCLCARYNTQLGESSLPTRLSSDYLWILKQRPDSLDLVQVKHFMLESFPNEEA